MKTTEDEEYLNFLPNSISAKDLRHTPLRFYMLFLACLLCIGSYFVYDNPAALEKELESVTYI